VQPFSQVLCNNKQIFCNMVTCLDHGDMVVQYAVMQGCVRLRDALKCILQAIFTLMMSRTATLKAAEKCWQRLLLAVRSRLTVLTVGHKRKHSACRAQIVGCGSDHTYISRVKYPQNVCRGSFTECNWAQADANLCLNLWTGIRRCLSKDSGTRQMRL